MYNQLYAVWKRELEEPDLVELPSDFYDQIIDYAKKIKEESRMLDKRTVKANLLKKEMQNMKRMVNELVAARYRKILNKAARGEEIPRDSLTMEDSMIYGKVSPLTEIVSNFASEIIHGRTPKDSNDIKHTRVAVRLLKDVPTIVGADLKTYGPFKMEDVASLPTENVRILIKQNLAEKVEIS
jgi:DNA replication factor GINS